MTAGADMGELPAPRHRRVAVTNLASHYVNLGLVFVQGLVLVPLYLRHIPAEVYGAWLATGNVLAWIELVDPGVSSVLQQRVAFAFGQRDRALLGATIGTGLALTVATALAPLVFLPVSGQVAGWVGYLGEGRQDLGLAFALALVGTGVALGSYGITAVNVGLQQAVATGVVSIVGGLSGIAVTVLALLGGYGVVALPLGLLVRSAVVLVGNLFAAVGWCRAHLRGLVRPNRTLLRALLAPVGATALSRIGVSLVTRVDAFVVARLLGPGPVVILTLTGRAVEVVRMAVDRIGASLVPSVAHLAGEGRTGRAKEVVHSTALAVGWGCAIGLGGVVALNGPFMVLWVGSQHFGGRILTVLMASAAVLMTLTAVMGNFVVALGGIGAIARLSFVEAAARLPALVTLVSAFGLKGVPLAAFLSSALVGSAWLPAVLGGLLGGGRGAERRVWGGAALRAMAGLLLGLALGAAVDRFGYAANWMTFWLSAVLVGAALTGLALALDGGLRKVMGEWAIPRPRPVAKR